MPRRRLQAWWVGFGFYTVIAGLFAIQKLVAYSSRGEALDPNGVLITFLGIYTWAALTPPIFWVSRRFPLGEGGRPRNLAVHALAAAVVIAIDLGSYVLLEEWLRTMQWEGGRPSLMIRFLRVVGWAAPGDVLWYASVAAVSHALSFHERFRQGALRASGLEGRLAKSRLQVLRMQLQPHFLFNTLHAISALIHDEPASARRMLGRLAHLLWLTLRNDGKQEVTLREELEMLDCYLEIQQVRFADRLTVRRDVYPAALAARVPNLVLQPLVENAVRHGISRSSSPGTIDLVARVAEGRLRLEVSDNGVGLPAGQPAREGVGLSNTRARLRQLYGEGHAFELRAAPRGGFSVAIEIPFREGVTPVGPKPIEEGLAIPSPRFTGLRAPASADAASVLPDDERAARPGHLAPADGWSSDSPSRLLPRSTRGWAIVVGGWLLFGIFAVGQSLLLVGPQGVPLPPQRLYLIGYEIVVWSAFTAIILWACERWPLGRRRSGAHVAAHVLTNAALLVYGSAMFAGMDEILHFARWDSPPPETWAAKFVDQLRGGWMDYLLRYWIVAGIGHAISFKRMARQREVEASRLETRLAQSELELLTLQLQPRFLFETLRAIAARVDADPRGADRMLTRLGDLMRIVLENAGRREVPLDRELSALEPYLRIQEARFAEGLQVRRDIAPEAAGAGVPNLVLQALVDHALRRRAELGWGPGRIEIRARRSNGTLELVVEEAARNGAAGVRGRETLPGGADRDGRPAGVLQTAPPSDTDSEGLESTRSRLRQLYGSDHRFVLAEAPGGGLRIDLTIPYRAAAEAGPTPPALPERDRDSDLQPAV